MDQRQTAGALTIQTSAAGQFIIFTDGTLSASGGYVISGGAARDSACVVGVDSTHWMTVCIQRDMDETLKCECFWFFFCRPCFLPRSCWMQW